MPARVTKLPIRMNSGTTDSVYWKPVSYTTVVADAIDGPSPRIHHSPANPTRPIENAIGSLANESTSIANSPTSASVMWVSGDRSDDALPVVVAVRHGDEREVDHGGREQHRGHEIGDRRERQLEHGGGVAIVEHAHRAAEHEPREAEQRCAAHDLGRH